MKKSLILLIIIISSKPQIKAQYIGQHNQDAYVNTHFFHNKRNGVFVDIGAADGTSISNTLFFEKNLNWTGICIEPHPDYYPQLAQCRKCICINGAISATTNTKKFRVVRGYPKMLSGLEENYDPRHKKRIAQEIKTYGGSQELIDVQCYRLNDLLKKFNIYHIDLLSIDTEGNELEILKSIDFKTYDISIIIAENNYGTSEMEQFLKTKGYDMVSWLGCDQVFKKQTFLTTQKA